MPVGTLSYLSDKDRIAKTMLDSEIRVQSQNMMQFRSMARPIKKFGAHKGQAVEIEKYQKIGKSTTPIAELQSLPLKRPNIKFVTVTVEEYGDGLTWTTKAGTIAEYSIDETMKKILARNIAETMDAVAGTEFRNADVWYVPTTGSAGTYETGTHSAIAGSSLKTYHIRDIITKAKFYNVPKWDGRYYLGIFSVFAMRQIFEDSGVNGLVDLHKYDMPEALIRGEIGAYFGLRFIEENNVLSNTLPGGSYEGEVIICGDDAVVEALAQPEHTLRESWDFGRFQAIAWQALTGFKKVWTHADDSEHRIIRVWGS